MIWDKMVAIYILEWVSTGSIHVFGSTSVDDTTYWCKYTSVVITMFYNELFYGNTASEIDIVITMFGEVKMKRYYC